MLPEPFQPPPAAGWEVTFAPLSAPEDKAKWGGTLRGDGVHRAQAVRVQVGTPRLILQPCAPPARGTLPARPACGTRMLWGHPSHAGTPSLSLHWSLPVLMALAQLCLCSLLLAAVGVRSIVRPGHEPCTVCRAGAAAAPWLCEQGCLCPPSLQLPWHVWRVLPWPEELPVGNRARPVPLRQVFGVGQCAQGGGSAGSSMAWYT